nr:MAG TPA: hypothetical protein [Caudoviricetes sp.]
MSHSHVSISFLFFLIVYCHYTIKRYSNLSEGFLLN